MTTTTETNPRAAELLDGLDDHPLALTEAQVRELHPHQQALRVRELETLAYDLVDAAWLRHADGHELAGRCVLFSGGNDSTVLAHLFRKRATHAVHANTTVGIERTRQFVRDTCAGWDLPLIEKTPPKSFRELVMEPHADRGGFPGPARHFKMYTRLKERVLEQVRNELVGNPRQRRVLFIAGRRRSESARRAAIPEFERKGSVIWASPLVLWTSSDMATYRHLHRGVPLNPVSAQLGMSGECLCGAFAEPGELARIRAVDPAVADELEQLERDVRAQGIVAPQRCEWGWGAYRDDPEVKAGTVEMGRLCRCHDHLATLPPSVTTITEVA